MNALRMLAALFFATLAIAAPIPQANTVAAADSSEGGGDFAADSYEGGDNDPFVGWKQ